MSSRRYNKSFFQAIYICLKKVFKFCASSFRGSQILIRTFFKGLCRHQRKWKQSGISGMHSPMEGRQHLLLSGSHQSAPRKPLRLRGQVQVLCLLHHPPGMEIDISALLSFPVEWFSNRCIFQGYLISQSGDAQCTLHSAKEGDKTMTLKKGKKAGNLQGYRFACSSTTLLCKANLSIPTLWC